MIDTRDDNVLNMNKSRAEVSGNRLRSAVIATSEAVQRLRFQMLNSKSFFEELREDIERTTLKHWLMLRYFFSVIDPEDNMMLRLPVPGTCLESLLERGGLTECEADLIEEEYERLRGRK